jgi:hypothetical protein
MNCCLDRLGSTAVPVLGDPTGRPFPVAVFPELTSELTVQSVGQFGK